jgi:carboxymethylenebutenolidase
MVPTHAAELSEEERMPVQTEWVTTKTPDGDMRVYLARPEGPGPHPGIVVIQEVFGVNEHMQDVTRRYAEEGFVAASPEIFHRFEQREVPYADIQTAMGLRNQLSADMVMTDVNATVDLLNGRPEVTKGQLGIVGFCYGGNVAYLAGTRNPAFKAIASYYGGGIAADNPAAPVNATDKIQAPIILFFGEKDQAIPMDQVQKIEDALKRGGKQYQLYTYPEAGHGFFCDNRPSYNAEAAADAWPKTIAFFKQHLKA